MAGDPFRFGRPLDDPDFVTLRNGTRVLTHILGTGRPPVVVGIPGIAGQGWELGFIEPLLGELTYIDIDRPGIGLSGPRPDPMKPVSVGGMAGEYLEVLEVMLNNWGLPADDLTLVTHSLGGNIASSLIELAEKRPGMGVRRWLDLDGSTPELVTAPTWATLTFDGPSWGACLACANRGRGVEVWPSGEVVFRNGTVTAGMSRIAAASPLDLIASSRETRLAVMPSDLEYWRVSRDPEFHPKFPRIPTTEAEENDWTAQGVAKSLALGAPFLIVARKTGHAFPYRDNKNFAYKPNPELVTQALRCMLNPSRGRSDADLAGVVAARGEIISRDRFAELAARHGLPPVVPGTFAGVPLAAALTDPAVAQVLQQTQQRRGSLGILRWAAEYGDVPQAVHAIDDHFSLHPQLAADPAASWLPAEPLLQAMGAQMTAFATEPAQPTEKQPRRRPPASSPSRSRRPIGR